MPVDTSRKTLDLLVLGGTSWLGGRIAAVATERGHRVSCLARGESGTPPDGVTWVRADRTDPAAYDRVAERDWDAVVDVSWQPDLVRSALLALQDRARHWVYVSSGSVYADDTTPGTGEEATLLPAHEGTGPGRGRGLRPRQGRLRAGLPVRPGPGPRPGGPRRPDRRVRRPQRPARLLARAGGARRRRRSGPGAAARGSRPGRRRRGPGALAGGDGRGADRGRVQRGRGRHVPSARSWRRRWRPPGGHRASWRPATSGSLPTTWSRGWVRSHCRSGCHGTPTPGSAPGATWRPGGAGLRLRPVAATVEAALRWERERGLERDRRAGLTPRREQELLAELESS